MRRRKISAQWIGQSQLLRVAKPAQRIKSCHVTSQAPSQARGAGYGEVNLQLISSSHVQIIVPGSVLRYVSLENVVHLMVLTNSEPARTYPRT
jgi:hypothetical protein